MGEEGRCGTRKRRECVAHARGLNVWHTQESWAEVWRCRGSVRTGARRVRRSWHVSVCVYCMLARGARSSCCCGRVVVDGLEGGGRGVGGGRAVGERLLFQSMIRCVDSYVLIISVAINVLSRWILSIAMDIIHRHGNLFIVRSSGILENESRVITVH